MEGREGRKRQGEQGKMGVDRAPVDHLALGASLLCSEPLTVIVARHSFNVFLSHLLPSS